MKTLEDIRSEFENRTKNDYITWLEKIVIEYDNELSSVKKSLII